jgi:hypothetical protein
VELEPASDSRLRRLTLSYRWRIQFYVIDPSLSPRYGCGQAVLRGWIRTSMSSFSDHRAGVVLSLVNGWRTIPQSVLREEPDTDGAAVGQEAAD